MAALALLALALLAPLRAVQGYCVPSKSCWPSAEQWQALRDSLSTGASLHALSLDSLDTCYAQGTNAIGLVAEGHGACMQDRACYHERCDKSSAFNLAAYSVGVRTAGDVKAALAFASEHNVSVSVKTSGHSYAGSSTMKGSLLIYMADYEKYGEVGAHTDSCGATTAHALKVGGGQPWGEAYMAASAAGRDVVGGGGLTVSAAGGWLMGGGLSALSRRFGYGIDNLLAVEVVLASGEVAVADACTHADLFWALRGGGGGTFGVTTAAWYRTHETSEVSVLVMSISDRNKGDFKLAQESWIDFWVEHSPKLDTRWTGGYWTTRSIVSMYFRGSEADARASFAGDLEAWAKGLPAGQAELVKISLTRHDSYWASRTSTCLSEDQSPACKKFGAETDATGQAGINIHSRMVPRAWVEADGGAAAKETLKWMARFGALDFNYFLGGAVADVAAGATAVHPSVRSSLWNFEVFHKEIIERLREDIPDAGVCFNHAAKDEPDWDTAAWGSNLPRLREVKRAYDPDGRMNCYHCVGYEPLEAGEMTPESCTGAGLVNCFDSPGVGYCGTCGEGSGPVASWKSERTYVDPTSGATIPCFDGLSYCAFAPEMCGGCDAVAGFFTGSTDCCPAGSASPGEAPAPAPDDDSGARRHAGPLAAAALAAAVAAAAL